MCCWACCEAVCREGRLPLRQENVPYRGLQWCLACRSGKERTRECAAGRAVRRFGREGRSREGRLPGGPFAASTGECSVQGPAVVFSVSKRKGEITGMCCWGRCEAVWLGGPLPLRQENVPYRACSWGLACRSGKERTRECTAGHTVRRFFREGRLPLRQENVPYRACSGSLACRSGKERTQGCTAGHTVRRFGREGRSRYYLRIPGQGREATGNVEAALFFLICSKLLLKRLFYLKSQHLVTRLPQPLPYYLPEES